MLILLIESFHASQAATGGTPFIQAPESVLAPVTWEAREEELGYDSK